MDRINIFILFKKFVHFVLQLLLNIINSEYHLLRRFCWGAQHKSYVAPFYVVLFPDHEEKATYVKFLLSNAEAGSIIGKGGSTITEFQSRSGARIQLSRNYEVFPGTPDRIVMVSGFLDDILKAVDLILGKLMDEVISCPNPVSYTSLDL